ncbi:MAG: tRNA (adenosine(37)-N6)-threonylcarbamoyltransferase complex transferase subunit TsaD [Candidatus Aegiribacteria sp.]|nr:tRNA (adenosine(37)-N6)-threonylcarbamoyltransferase complex transferase subunit TsaD [Candidatus Aegiribacteria sp.]
MRILAVETSCDDTAVALLDGCSAIAERVHSQEVHSEHGGIVPELASRAHMKILPGLVREVLLEGGMVGLEGIDVFAATAGPGLTGSLLVGLAWSKAAAWAAGKPFLGINHLAAHLYIHYGQRRRVVFPAVALLVSGGHTSLFRMNSWQEILLQGSTRDDAAGEAFDKTAKLTGLGYPGGAALDIAADSGNPDICSLPSPMADPALPEFSFSGLKTAAKLLWEGGADRCDLAASFRKTVVDILVSKLMYQSKEFGAKSVLAAGGVTANSLLRKVLRQECAEANLELFLPDRHHSTDNALMVGRAAAAALEQNPLASSPLSCNAFARWSGTSLSPIACP